MDYRPSRGFSLIEVLVAIAIIGTLIASVSVMLQRIPVSGRETRDQDLALKIARNQIEMLRAGGYAALPASGSFTHSFFPLLSAPAGSITVADANAKTKQVTVQVSWQGAGSVARNVTLTTLITQDVGLP